MDDDLTKYFSERPTQRQFLHYYSDNNSCLRKSYWEIFPYQDVDYGEDQLWADWIIKSNKTKAFATTSLKHSAYQKTHLILNSFKHWKKSTTVQARCSRKM